MGYVGNCPWSVAAAWQSRSAGQSGERLAEHGEALVPSHGGAFPGFLSHARPCAMSENIRMSHSAPSPRGSIS